jgi:hypothetical protein
MTHAGTKKSRRESQRNTYYPTGRSQIAMIAVDNDGGNAGCA